MSFRIYIVSLVSISFIFFSCCGNSPTKPDEKEKTLHVIWAHKYEIIGSRAPQAVPLVIDNSHLIYTGGYGVTKLRLWDGKVVWNNSVDSESAVQGDKLLLDDDRILSVHRKELIAWDIFSGQEILRIGSNDGIILFNGGENTVINNGYAMIGDSKYEVYILNRGGDALFTINVKPFSTNAVSYSANLIFVSQFNIIQGAKTVGKIFALNAQTGDSLWTYNTEINGFIYAAPVIENGILYAGSAGNSSQNVFVALDAQTGEIEWEFLSDDPLKWTQSFIIGPNNIFASGSGKIFALNKNTGELAWEYGWESSTLVKPVYLGGYVYQSNHGSIFVLDAETGELVHEEPAPEGSGYIWHLAVSEDKLIVQSSYKLVAYQPWHLRE